MPERVADPLPLCATRSISNVTGVVVPAEKVNSLASDVPPQKLAVPVALNWTVPPDSVMVESAVPASNACELMRQRASMVLLAKSSQVTVGTSVTVTSSGSLTHTPCALDRTNCVMPGARPITLNDAERGPPAAKFSVRLRSEEHTSEL